ncbi:MULTISPECIES: AfsR/SARP family transcriptional regulator [Amycolatopsis]|uniref:BTAD domain-containing putative transcriptional regulator n=1 Tax=Amycolatopsis albidoflavus TaxID=102226 RepID=A0ABW5I811_9PSEU
MTANAERRRLLIELLGPISATYDGAVLDLGPAFQRTILAILALRSNTVVSREELIDAVWGDRPPRTVEGSIYTYISKLRRALEPSLNRSHEARLLLSNRHGYCLQLDDDAIDVRVFETAIAEGRARFSRGELPKALDAWQSALDMSHGQPLGDAVGPFAEAARLRLGELRLDVLEQRSEALLALGRNADILAELPSLIGERPMRERPYELLMLALYRSGRQADALQTYQRARTLLIDELGIEPGASLRALHERILADDPDLRSLDAEPSGMNSAPSPQAIAPGQLPHDVSGFTGREAEQKRLVDLCRHGTWGAFGSAVVISAIDGTAGVGKTALAVHVAHGLRNAFPDGQLFLNLRGFDPRQPPTSVSDALSHLLYGLGVKPDEMPADQNEQAALYRTLLSGKRVLVLLDNAVSAEQVRPLLPGSAGCVAIVTSRNRLSGLVARDGAARIALDLLSPGEALELLRRTVGNEAVDAEPGPAAELVERCGLLPLAVRIVAERIATGDYRGIADMCQALQAEHDRLDTLSVPDDEFSAVRQVFSVSYQSLKPELARTFRLLGLHRGAEFSLPAAAALLGVDADTARRSLDSLARQHLVVQTAPGRYRFHDLLRVYAAECARQDETSAEQAASERRVLEWYFASVLAEWKVVAVGQRPPDSRPFEHSCPPMSFENYGEALAWATREHETIAAAVKQALDAGENELSWKLATALGPFYQLTKRPETWRQTLEVGLVATRNAGDRDGEARTLNQLGIAHNDGGHYEEGAECLSDALQIRRAIADLSGAAITASNLGLTLSLLGRAAESVTLHREAVDLAQKSGDSYAQGAAALNLAFALRALGEFDEAIVHNQEAVAAFEPDKANYAMGHALAELGETFRQAGKPGTAVGHLERALEFRQAGRDRWGIAVCLRMLGHARADLGQTPAARELLTQALSILDEMDTTSAAQAERIKVNAVLDELPAHETGSAESSAQAQPE